MGKMDHESFFKAVRERQGPLSDERVIGFNALLEVWETPAYVNRPAAELAAIMGQVHIETGGRMIPVRETFAANDTAAKNTLERLWKAGKLKGVTVPYWRDGWFGRGQIQLTWKTNYVRADKELGLNGRLVANPSLALDPHISAMVAIEGCIEGWFTGKKITDYTKGIKPDFDGARRVVNGYVPSVAAEGARRSMQYLEAIELGQRAYKPPAPPTPKPVPQPLPAPQSWWAILIDALRRLFTRK